jgi:hypothetical protein
MQTDGRGGGGGGADLVKLPVMKLMEGMEILGDANQGRI